MSRLLRFFTTSYAKIKSGLYFGTGIASQLDLRMRQKSGYQKTFLLLILIIAASISAWIGASRAISHPGASFDFQWDAARALLLGENPYIITTEWSHQTQARFLGEKLHDPLMANQPPSLLMLLWPFSWLSWSSAKWAWMSSNFIFTATILWSLRRLFPTISVYTFSCLSLILIASTPWRVVLQNGQHTLFAFSALLLAFIYRETSPLRSGLFLAISWFKYTLTGPFVFFWFTQKSWRGFVIACSFHLLLSLMAGIYLGESPIQLIRDSFEIANTLGSAGDFDIPAVLGPHLGMPIAYILSLSVLALTLWGWKKNRDPIATFSLTCVVTMILSYHRIYDYSILIFPLFWLMSKSKIEQSRIFVSAMFGWIMLIWFLLKPIAFFSILTPFVPSTVLIWSLLLLALSLFQTRNPQNRIGEKSSPQSEPTAY
jgi:hypothetical protein